MKILIVDDSRIILAHAFDLMKKNNLGVQIATASSGEDALEIIREDAVDIVLLDIVMPNMTGIQVLEIIKSNDDLKGIKVLMFSSLMDKATLMKCFTLGASDYITKPIDETEFIARLKNAIKEITLIKEEKILFESIKKKNVELSLLNKQLKDTQNQLITNEKMAGIGHLAAGIAHEINNPLGFINSNFSTLKKYIYKLKEMISIYQYVMDRSRDSIDETGLNSIEEYKVANDLDFIYEDIDELFSDTDEGISRVSKIVISLRNFSRIDSNEDYELFDIEEGLESTLIIANNEIKFNCDVKKDFMKVSEVKAMGSKLNQVFLNMILNASHAIKDRFGDRRGLITLRTYEDSANVFIEIEDNGQGIEEGHISSIFNPFFTSKPVGEGTGLGLSISYDIVVNKHKGNIEVSSELGQGTVFKISLPKNME